MSHLIPAKVTTPSTFLTLKGPNLTSLRSNYAKILSKKDIAPIRLDADLRMEFTS
jgi:hypothetical protein